MRFQALLVLLLLCSCGKEASTTSKKTDPVVQPPTVSERLFDAEKELRRAVKTNDTVALRRVLFENSELSLNRALDDGDTLLTYAIKKRFPLIRNILLEKGANPNLVSHHIEFPDQNPLMIAAHLGDTGAIFALLEYNASLNSQDTIGDTALHKAIKNGYDEAAKALIRAGADLQIENDRFDTPLETADSLGRKEIGDFLRGLVNLELGAPTIAVFRQILIDADVVNYRKLIALHPEVIEEYSSINPIALTVESRNDLNGFELAQSLIARKVPVDGPENSETTPLIRAVALKKRNFTELFLRHRADLQKTDSEDRPALYYAIINNDDIMVDLLVNSGALPSFDRWKNGKRISFRGCKVADSRQRNLREVEENAINRRIQSSLGCRWPR